MSDKKPAIQNTFTQTFGLRAPIIMAPMFLVSNNAMMQAGMRSGIMATFPTLNYRKEHELEQALDDCNEFLKSNENHGNYGVNLIVQNTNIWYKKHLDICIKKKVPFFITSLGNPDEVIQRGREYGAKVFCDVTQLKHAEKVVKQGCDGLIAVGQGAGGHAGPLALQVFIPALKREFPGLMIIGAGGVATGQGMLSLLSLSADGVSVGTRFIASKEADVRKDYKQAILDYGMSDIVMTDKISGTPCTVINTPYVQRKGTKLGFIGRWLNRNKTTKKFFKSLLQLRGLNALEKAAFGASYQTMWCAGQTVELIEEELPIERIVENMIAEYAIAKEKIPPVTEM